MQPQLFCVLLCLALLLLLGLFILLGALSWHVQWFPCLSLQILHFQLLVYFFFFCDLTLAPHAPWFRFGCCITADYDFRLICLMLRSFMHMIYIQKELCVCGFIGGRCNCLLISTPRFSPTPHWKQFSSCVGVGDFTSKEYYITHILQIPDEENCIQVCKLPQTLANTEANRGFTAEGQLSFLLFCKSSLLL